MRQLLCTSILLSALGLSLATSGAAASTDGRAKIGPALQARLDAGQGAQDVLVFLSTQADLSGATRLRTKAARSAFVVRELVATAQSTQGPIVQYLQSRGAKMMPYYIANVVAVDKASPTLIQELASRHDVGRVIANPTVRVVGAASTAMLTDEPSIDAIGANITSTGADRVWTERNVRGEGIVVAGQDTGIEWTHPGLKRQYRGFDGTTASHDYNWHDSIHAALTTTANSCGYDLRVPCDDHGHGTHTIGTVVGDDGVGNQVGMAPGAKWIGCRNMDAGLGKPSTYIECFQFFLAPWPYGGDPLTTGDPSRAADVMNNSWGCPASEGCDGTEFLEVLGNLKQAGVMVVAAAGNEGAGCSTIADAPAHHTDDSFAVGALSHTTGAIASFSSRGPSAFDGKISPDVSAPGVSIRSAIPGGGFSGSSWSGTSMASPHVAGAVALLWSARPEFKGDVEATAARFRSTAVAKTSTQTCGGTPGSQVPNNTFGHGQLDAYKAVTAQ